MFRQKFIVRLRVRLVLGQRKLVIATRMFIT